MGVALVVLIDTGLTSGVVSRHRNLKGVRGDPEQADLGHYRGHGVFVAGVLRAMAPAAQVHVEALLFERGAVLESDLAPAMHRALDQAPDIISMSAGTRTRSGLPLKSLQSVWEDRLRHLKGTVLVAAAGNDGDWQPFYPAAFPWAVSVGALDSDAGTPGRLQQLRQLGRRLRPGLRGGQRLPQRDLPLREHAHEGPPDADVHQRAGQLERHVVLHAARRRPDRCAHVVARRERDDRLAAPRGTSTGTRATGRSSRATRR